MISKNLSSKSAHVIFKNAFSNQSKNAKVLAHGLPIIHAGEVGIFSSSFFNAFLSIFHQIRRLIISKIGFKTADYFDENIFLK